MFGRTTIEEQLQYTLKDIDVPGLTDKYSGKVRDCYTQGDRRILITSDRLSAFDVILTTIPFKGQLLNGMASYWFQETKDIVRNHIIEEPHPNIFISEEVSIVPIEIVMRGYLTGSAWRDYEAGKAVSGIALPKGLKKHQRFERPILTPSTKAPSGTHDLPISGDEVIRSGVVEAKRWAEISEVALALFQRGTERAAERGLILVDTKYEMGISKRGELVLADEIHTQDSSRYWMANSYEARFGAGEDPVMLDKEFVRRWLIARGYMGEGTPPQIHDSFRVEVAETYIRTYELITGKTFTAQVGPIDRAIVAIARKYAKTA